jgi:DNA-nicking Smr family endonuclease
MRGVRPLGGRPSRVAAPPAPAAPKTPWPPGHRAGPPALKPLSGEAGADSTGAYAYVADGVSRARVRALYAGRERVEATLDLHGERAAPAEQRLRAFLRTARVAGRRLLLVVHGRGHGSGSAGPVLRDVVIEQLTRGPLAAEVLAVVSAPPALGGPGAALVWLRK